MLNNIVVMGRLARDPDLRMTTNGKMVCLFTIANERPKGGEIKEVDYLDVEAWNATAEFVDKWFKKGTPIVVIGRVQTRTYKDKEDRDRKVWFIVASGVDFVNSRKGEDDAAL